MLLIFVTIAKIACHILRGDGIEVIRGLGAMLGLQLRDSNLTQNVVEYCFEKGIIHGWPLHYTPWSAPPLIIEEELLEKVFSDHFGWGGNVLLSRFACWSYYPYKLSALI